MSSQEEIDRKKKIEEERREKRKQRIQGNIKNRIDFVSDRANDLAKPSETITTNNNNHTLFDNEDNEGDEGDNENEVQPTLKNRKNQKSNNNSNNNENQQQSQQPNTEFNMKNILKRNRFIKEPLSFRVSRFLGAFFYSAILVSLTVLTSSTELMEELREFNFSGNRTFLHFFIGFIVDSDRGRRFLLMAVAASWLLWELIIVMANSNYTKHVTKSPVISYIRRDLLLLGFFYILGLDVSLRLINEYQPHYPMDRELIQGLYPPLIISFIGSVIISIIPKHVPLLKLNDIVAKLYNTAAHIVLLVIILILCIDDWSCTSQLCKNQIVYYMFSRSRGLLFWSHLCSNFVSHFV